jgi:hypothetical protein
MNDELESLHECLDIPDDALTEIAEVAPSLTEQERTYVYWRTMAIPPVEAFKRAQYKGSSWRVVETRPKVRTAMADLYERLEPEHRITQKKVVGYLVDALEMARGKEQAKTMVEAAVALANVTGVGAATKVQIDQRTQFSIEHREETRALNRLPRTQLESMIGVTRVLPNPDVLDAEYEEVVQKT